MKTLGWNLGKRLSADVIYDDGFCIGCFFEKSPVYGGYLQLNIMLGYMSVLITYTSES